MWKFAAVFLLCFVIAVDPVRSQINCALGIVPACEKLAEDYK